jgi:hypothetical protein
MAIDSKLSLVAEIDVKLRAAGRHSAQWHKANVVFVPVLGGAFGLFCSYVSSMDAVWAVAGFLSFAALTGVSIWFQATAPLVVESIGELHELRNATERAQQNANYGASIAVLASTLLKFVEARTEIGVRNDNELGECVLEALQALEQAAPTLFSFAPSEKWSFTVFRADDVGNLTPVKRVASASHPRKVSRPRSWRTGEGHVGQAFQKRQMIITVDATAQEVAALFRASGSNERPGDDELYRSYVSAPFGLTADDRKPLGVLVVTSDVPGRFDIPARQPVELVASVLAAVTRIRYRSHNSELKEPR